ncbi:ABC transporter permease [Pelotomaculum propionicicum]|uniref:fluoroquinolone export ABC transporter permease subunit n=1 Tax=Pelotomaculum propionicicum TaxID=258475 RepID=UPI003B7DBD1C
MRILSAFKYDVKFQFRHGFYYAYLFLTVVYIAGLRLVPETYRPFLTGLVIFTDPSVLGFFFIGGIMLLEKGQNTLESLFVTPLRVNEYIWAKVASLTMLSLLSSLVIAVFTLGAGVNIALLALGVSLGSVFFTLLGFALAARARSLNQYFFYSIPTAIFDLPLLKYLGLPDTWLYYLLPSRPELLLIEGAMGRITPGQTLYAVVALCVWILIAYRWAHSWFYRYTVLGLEVGRR